MGRQEQAGAHQQPKARSRSHERVPICRRRGAAHRMRCTPVRLWMAAGVPAAPLRPPHAECSSMPDACSRFCSCVSWSMAPDRWRCSFCISSCTARGQQAAQAACTHTDTQECKQQESAPPMDAHTVIGRLRGGHVSQAPLLYRHLNPKKQDAWWARALAGQHPPGA